MTDDEAEEAGLAPRLRQQTGKSQWRYFFANPKLRTKYAHKEAHKVIRRRGKITGFHSLPTRKHPRKRA